MKKISVCLFDASFREKLHAPIFLNNQTVPRNKYEILWFELYDRKEGTLVEYEKQGILDKLITLKFPREKFHNYPRAFNEAILRSNGEIWCMLEGDAICSPTFVKSILDSFEKYKDKNVIVYIDGLRHYSGNSYDSWENVCTRLDMENWCNWNKNYKTTTGVSAMISKFGESLLDFSKMKHALHWTNYGTCFSAYKKDLINIGGADEHKYFLGAFNSAFEMGWRLVKLGFYEYWHPTEFIIHPHHTGTNGSDSTQFPEGFSPPEWGGFQNKYNCQRLTGTLEVEKEKQEDILKGLPLIENIEIRKLRLGGK